MRWARILGQRFRSLFQRSTVDRELEQELEIHLAQLTREYRESGMPEAEARLAARRAFGGEALTREECREKRGTGWMEDAGKDLNYAARMMAKSPAFTLTAVLSLALGVGANTAIFSFMKKVIFELLPVREAEQIVKVSRKNMLMADMNAFNYPLFRDFQNAKDLPFDGFIASTSFGRSTLLTESGAEPVQGDFVSGNFFEVLGVRPALGRLFTSDDDVKPDGHPVVVLSYNFWQRRFGGDAAILNRVIRINNFPFTVIGVSAQDFDGMDPGSSPDYRVTFSMEPSLAGGPTGQSSLPQRGSWWISVYGRLKRGVSYERAGDMLQPLLMRSFELAGQGKPMTDFRRKVLATERMFVEQAAQGGGGFRQRYERAIWVLMGMVGAVLLLACVNVAHLLLARASAREHEFSVRRSLGAGRGRLVRQLLTESMLLAVGGGAVGLLVAKGFSRMLLGLLVSDRAHSTLNASLDGAVLTFNFAIAVVAGLAFGMIPVLRASAGKQMDSLRGTRAGSARRMIGRKLMVSVQIALSLVLLAGAGLFLRTLSSLKGIDPGFRTSGIIQMSLNPAGYTTERTTAFYREIVERIRALPGVQGVVASRQRVVSNSSWGSGIRVAGFTTREGDRGPNRDAIGPGYFSVLGLPLVAGREFTAQDTATAAKVAIVNESFARFYFGGESALGKLIGPGGKEDPDITIVGVVKDSKYRSLREDVTRFWYVPVEQVPTFRGGTLILRTSGNQAQVINGVRATVAAADRNIALFDIKTVESQINENFSMERLLAMLSAMFGGVAALLAGTGLFGVLAYSVTQRTREIGIRMALGARPAQAAWTILREVGWFTALGLAAGLGLALACGQFVGKMLFGVKPNDSATLVAACIGIAVVALAAGLVPARRAAGVEASVALRTE